MNSKSVVHMWNTAPILKRETYFHPNVGIIFHVNCDSHGQWVQVR